MNSAAPSLPSSSQNVVAAPSDDKRWRIVGATMRRYGFAPSALIETLHTVQNSFGYLDTQSLRFVARSLKVPLSKAYGVATFYGIFRLKPHGEHTCVICTGTACHIKGAAKLLATIDRCANIRDAETTKDNKLSLVTARCFGACGIAPAAIVDGQVIGNLSPETMEELVRRCLKS
ncbi:MAG: hydrogenase HoxE [Candidatus Melainabacteria bacterium]|nr:MAG: hydrogenase HoxE [Candidatus Melainabacteria bacterium]